LEGLRARAQEFGVEIILVSDADTEKTLPLIDGTVNSLPILVAPRDRTSFLKEYKTAVTPSYCLVDVEGKVQAAGTSIPELVDRIDVLGRTAKGGDVAIGTRS
jgi:hypothetical protein